MPLRANTVRKLDGRTLSLNGSGGGGNTSTSTEEQNEQPPAPSEALKQKTKAATGRSLLGYENVPKLNGAPPYQNDWVPLAPEAGGGGSGGGGVGGTKGGSESSSVRAVLEVRCTVSCVNEAGVRVRVRARMNVCVCACVRVRVRTGARARSCACAPLIKPVIITHSFPHPSPPLPHASTPGRALNGTDHTHAGGRYRVHHPNRNTRRL